MPNISRKDTTGFSPFLETRSKIRPDRNNGQQREARGEEKRERVANNEHRGFKDEDGINKAPGNEDSYQNAPRPD